MGLRLYSAPTSRRMLQNQAAALSGNSNTSRPARPDAVHSGWPRCCWADFERHQQQDGLCGSHSIFRRTQVMDSRSSREPTPSTILQRPLVVYSMAELSKLSINIRPDWLIPLTAMRITVICKAAKTPATNSKGPRAVRRGRNLEYDGDAGSEQSAANAGN